uniref:Uncharacterized protein n=2 Tax=Cercopithecinae TaxID=9528 RepID=A0A2K5KV43_CERAT
MFFIFQKEVFKNFLKCDCHLFSTKNFLRFFKRKIEILSLPPLPIASGFQNESTSARVGCTGAWRVHTTRTAALSAG